MAPYTGFDMQSFGLQNSLLAFGGAFVILSACYVLGSAIYNLYFNPLRAYPGPKLCAVTRIPWLLALIHGRQTHNMRNLHEIYGEVVRIAPDELSYINPKAWKDIYAHRQGKEEMDKQRKFYSEQPGDHIIIANRENHTRFRRNLSHAFSDSSMREQEPLIKRYVDLLIQRLGEISDNGQTPLNIVAWYNFTTFDLIGDLTFGESFDCLEKSDYHPWISLIFDSIKVGNYIQALKYIPGGLKLASLLVSKELLAKKAAHYALTIEKVKKRVSRTEERHDFMDNILKREKNRMTFPELVGNSSVLIIAGSETTATVLSGVTFHLLKNPTIMAKLVHEIRSTFANEDDITIAAVGNLKYMLACLEEAMRIYPAVPVGLQRIVPGKGDFINGKWVPGGTVVSVHMVATYRSPLNFRDPDSFIPERFLGGERFVNDNRSALNPFSLGPRNCIGKNLAYAEMRLILARVLYNFDLQLANENDNWLDQKTYTLWEKGPMNVLLKKRSFA